MIASAPSRLTDPGLASVIFAPAPRNGTLSSVTICIDLSDASAIEWVANQEPEMIKYLAAKHLPGGTEFRQLVSCLLHLCCTSVAQAPVIVANTFLRLPSEVPARTFPFARHLDILGLPVVEGMDFDLDELLDA